LLESVLLDFMVYYSTYRSTVHDLPVSSSVYLFYAWKNYDVSEESREEKTRNAEKSCVLTAGWKSFSPLMCKVLGDNC
ncbi:hypothetical protein SK128_020899, partial [Halocaridina rubra]